MNQKFNFISWNVNGLRAIMRKNFFEFVEQEQPDFLCLQETKVHENDLDLQMKNLNGYDYSYFSSASKKGYSGVAIYSKHKPIHTTRNLFENPKFDQEGRVVLTEFKQFILINVYFPNGKASAARLAYKMEFYQKFLEKMQKLLKQGKKIIVCGDVNTAHKEIDLARPKANSEISGFLPAERAWIDDFLKAGFLDSFRVFHPQQKDQYSWWSYRARARSRNVGWRIDYFFISQNLKKYLKDAQILNQVMGSDHCPVKISLEI